MEPTVAKKETQQNLKNGPDSKTLFGILLASIHSGPQSAVFYDDAGREVCLAIQPPTPHKETTEQELFEEVHQSVRRGIFPISGFIESYEGHEPGSFGANIEGTYYGATREADISYCWESF